MPSLDDITVIAAALPGSEERETAGGRAWFVRNKLYAWECRPWPSTPAEVREILAAEVCAGVKLADADDALALREMAPDVFLPQTSVWGEPKVAFRLGDVDPEHLAELVIEAWRVQAPKYLRREFDGDV